MLFSEKMAQVPQPRRADLWSQYRILCNALALNVRLKKENRSPAEAELMPLKTAAKTANDILSQFGMEPSFFPESEAFFDLLIQELSEIRSAPAKGD
ncbi:MAG: hypothetical protein J6B54_03700 [Clostridia bacterium]|nr:hypothetical protein [Clostridia bacterium]